MNTTQTCALKNINSLFNAFLVTLDRSCRLGLKLILFHRLLHPCSQFSFLECLKIVALINPNSLLIVCTSGFFPAKRRHKYVHLEKKLLGFLKLSTAELSLNILWFRRNGLQIASQSNTLKSCCESGYRLPKFSRINITCHLLQLQPSSE